MRRDRWRGSLCRNSDDDSDGERPPPQPFLLKRLDCRSCCSPSTRQLFGIFRPVSQIKRLHIVRHGQSTYNEAVETRGSAFADPRHIFDAPLTPLGRRQAGGDLRKELSRMNLKVEDTLWIVSPLTRALETFALGCPFLEEGFGLGKGESGGGGESGEGKEKATAKNLPKLSVVVRARDLGEALHLGRHRPPCLAAPAQLARAGLAGRFGFPARTLVARRARSANCAEQQKFTLPERAQELETRVAARSGGGSTPARRRTSSWSGTRCASGACRGRAPPLEAGKLAVEEARTGQSAAGPGGAAAGKGLAGGAGATTLKNCEVATLYF